jgi:hypothetical protein
MSAQRITQADLRGATINDAYQKGDVLTLSLRGRDGRAFHLAVMRDPEGNGPGSLHVYDSHAGTFIGCLGGR